MVAGPINYVIVTNSYHRQPVDLVWRNLRASLAQKIAPKKIIFIDQNSTPIQLPDDLKRNSTIEHCLITTSSISAARSQAPIPNDIDWIIFCDDDGFLESNYSVKLAELIRQHPERKIFAGSIRRDDNQQFYSIRHQVGGSLKKIFQHKLLMGSNFVVHRNVFFNLEKFDQRFGVGSAWGSGEDSDFTLKAYFAKIPMEYHPELIVYHIAPFSEKGLVAIRKAFLYGRGKGALVSKWLFEKKKILILLEAGEMLLVPWVLIIKNLLFLRWSEIPIQFSAFCGRIWGVVAFLAGNK